MKKYLIVLFALFLPITIMAATTSYTVKSGDTLKSIATKYGITLDQLITLNPQLIQSRQRINVPVSTSPTTPTTPASTTVPTPPVSTLPFETKILAFVTGYTYWDNTPPGSADISNPIIHKKAGGIGTYVDPITVAVGHSIIGKSHILDYPAGTRFYIPNVRRYFIVEDTCGDGNTPQNGPCHTGYPAGTTSWVDIWIDGASGSKSVTNSCAEKITGNHLIIKNPATNYAVVSGPIFQNGACTLEYGDALKLN